MRRGRLHRFDSRSLHWRLRTPSKLSPSGRFPLAGGRAHCAHASLRCPHPTLKAALLVRCGDTACRVRRERCRLNVSSYFYKGVGEAGSGRQLLVRSGIPYGSAHSPQGGASASCLVRSGMPMIDPSCSERKRGSKGRATVP